jgi:HK97 gp10 family phage protein
VDPEQTAQEVKKALMEAFKATVEAVPFMAENVAIEKVPVDTGRLKGTIKAQIEGTSENPVLVLSANTDYAKYVEFGTYKMKAQPFLRPAIEYIEENAPKLFEKELKKRGL